MADPLDALLTDAQKATLADARLKEMNDFHRVVLEMYGLLSPDVTQKVARSA